MNVAKLSSSPSGSKSQRSSWPIVVVSVLSLLALSLSITALLFKQQEIDLVRGLRDATYNEILALRNNAWHGIRRELALRFAVYSLLISFGSIGLAGFSRRAWLIGLASISVLAALIAVGYNLATGWILGLPYWPSRATVL